MAVVIQNGYVYQLPWKQTQPVTIPTQIETVFSTDFYLEELSLTNTTDSTIAVDIFDRQGTPIAFLDTINIPPRSLYVVNGKARWFPSGLTWQASATGLIGFMRGRVS